MSSEIHCNAELYFDMKYFDDVYKAINESGICVDKGSRFGHGGYYEFAAAYMDTDDAQALVDKLGDKLDDFSFYFEDYSFGNKWRYTKESGVEEEETYYKSDAAHALREKGYETAEIRLILDAIGE